MGVEVRTAVFFVIVVVLSGVFLSSVFLSRSKRFNCSDSFSVLQIQVHRPVRMKTYPKSGCVY